MAEDIYTHIGNKVSEVTEARAVQTLVESLAPFVAKTDIGMSRTDFLRTVASRILDELDPEASTTVI